MRTAIRSWTAFLAVTGFVMAGFGGFCSTAAEKMIGGMEMNVPFTGGTEGYDTYRIPAIIEAVDGTLVALAEGRRNGAGDSGDIDLVYRLSHDGGRLWEPMRVLWDDGRNTCGNPCPVVAADGTIRLLMTWNRGEDTESRIIAGTSHDTRKVFLASSSDHGRSWTVPVEITADVKSPEWTWFATGPGVGIRLVDGPHAGRFVIPCDHIERDSRRMRSHVILSDDGGVTWRRGGTAPLPDVNECEVAELRGGAMLLNMRSYDRTTPTRQNCRSDDGGETWTDQRHDPTLIEPVCQASFRRLDAGGGTVGGESITADPHRFYLFSNPASTSRRERMTVRLSDDVAATWRYARTLDTGPAAYSCLVVLRDGTCGCLYEWGERSAYETIRFARFTPEWIMEGDAKEPE